MDQIGTFGASILSRFRSLPRVVPSSDQRPTGNFLRPCVAVSGYGFTWPRGGRVCEECPLSHLWPEISNSKRASPSEIGFTPKITRPSLSRLRAGLLIATAESNPDSKRTGQRPNDWLLRFPGWRK